MSSIKFLTMKKAVMDLYSSAKWKGRVLQMPANQIIAIYHRSEESGLFDKRNESKKLAKKMKKENERYVQLTIFDYLEDKNEQSQQ